MEIPINAIGFSDITEQEHLNKLVESIMQSPTHQNIARDRNKIQIAEYRKKVAPHTYVMVRVSVEDDIRSTRVNVEECEAYVEATLEAEFEEIEVECVDDTLYYVICEEKNTAMQIIFWMQNLVEYLNATDKGRPIIGASILGIALEGTIILPILKDEEELEFEIYERDKLREIVDRIKEGDEEAQAQLEEEEKELDEQLMERLKEEDFLSIMSGYFIPLTYDESMYAILGDITDIKERKNQDTGEEMYVFNLDINSMNLEVVINKKTLIGMPTVGMRFLGSCWLQGQILMG
ncbi:MAG: hypothetical protein ATN33_03640 [Epulopiscium sp. Nele67-Bin001]|nr:MAG: hypothetical protein BEN18_06375 [Epulopiscium sp. Nuni2H_MBin001]OON90218.1 MAG: hypothetical protein ATN33_03640 [Epulopiscium sp. Nele67-Bin001]